MNDRPPRWVTPTFAVLCASVIGFAWVTRLVPPYADELDYWEIAGNLASGQGFSLGEGPTAFRPPAWPLLLVPFRLLSLGMGTAVLLSIVCLIGSGWLAGHLGRELTGDPRAALAGLLVLAYPINIYTSATLYPQMLALLCTIFLWLAVARAWHDGLTWQLAALAGAAAAALALSVPTLAFTAGVLAVAGTGQLIRFHRRGAVAALWVTMTGLVGAWVVRNWLVFGEFIPLSTSTGINLLLGNNPNATADSGVNSDISDSLASVYSQGLTENGRSQALTREALDWISGHPWDAALLYLNKTLHYFAAYDRPATQGQGSSLQELVAWAALISVAALTALRWTPLATRRFPLTGSERLMAWVFVLNAPVMAIFFTRVRFRIPLDAFLLVEAAVALVALWYALTARIERAHGSTETAGLR